MIGWLGGAYPWVKALHVIAVIFWVAGLLIMGRYLVHQAGEPERGAVWAERERLLRRIILTPGMIFVWVLGLMLATSYGLEGAGWLRAKIALVVALSGLHGWQVATARRLAAGTGPAPRTLKLMNEVPALLTIAIVVLVEVKPF